MARDELVELLADLRRDSSREQLRDSLPAIIDALDGISRKRSHFLEDACAVVLRLSFSGRSNESKDGEGSDNDGGSARELQASTLEAVAICRAFAEPLVAKLPMREAAEDADITRQRAVLVAFLLHLLELPELSQDEDEAAHSASVSVAALAVRCGLDLLTIAWTLRFREELDMFRLMLLPHRPVADMQPDDQDDTDEYDDDEGESDAEDETWIVEQVGSAMGFTEPLEYFIKESGQEYAFASWSPVGIVRLAALRSSQADATESSPVLSPYSNLFVMAAVAQALLQGATIELKRQALIVLKTALAQCNAGQLELAEDLATEDIDVSDISLTEASAAFRARDWISPLVELTSNAMVSFPEPSDRAMGLAIFRQLLQVVEPSHRFWLIRRLALRCPYGNIAAILIDQLRNDTFRAWSASAPAETTSPYSSPPVASLIVDLLTLLTERDLKLHADLLASVASLIRFVVIRDKENRTGLRDADRISTVKETLHRLQSRLRSTLAQAQPVTTASVHELLHDENSRFVLVEAALDSTISLLP